MEGRGEPALCGTVSRYETIQWFGMCEIEATPARHEQFTPYTRHLLEDLDTAAVGGKIFGSEQSGRACADNGNGRGHRETAHGCLIAMSRGVCQAFAPEYGPEAVSLSASGKKT
ncbi:hypothetical protein Gbfr_001_208 [Gluconobacter frateurii M-2]|nr:hypothetical protein Gbfr_001_208 [Gluconobacter frateurii M-2]